MGHVCYSCKKELKWHMLKITLDEVVKGFTGFSKKIPPTGMTSEDRLCNDCHEKLAKPGEPKIDKPRSELVQKHIDAQRAANQKASSPMGKCYWCKNNQHIIPETSWILEDHSQCFDCVAVIAGLTSIKLKELYSLEQNHYNKILLLQKLHGEASTASFQAGQKKYSDVFNGVAGAGIMGGFIPNSDTQHLENVANQNEGSLELKLMDAKQETIRIKNLIKNEKIYLVKKHFFNLDSNESETKVHSANTMKTNESDDPVEILKIRLAKGEITVEEIDKIPKSFFHAGGFPNSPSEILKKRYATGEITLDEFNKIKENLDKF